MLLCGLQPELIKAAMCHPVLEESTFSHKLPLTQAGIGHLPNTSESSLHSMQHPHGPSAHLRSTAVSTTSEARANCYSVCLGETRLLPIQFLGPGESMWPHGQLTIELGQPERNSE